MTQLYRFKTKDGDIGTLSYDFKERGHGVSIIFVTTIYTEHNKWNKPNVVADMFIDRCSLSKDNLEFIGGKERLESMMKKSSASYYFVKEQMIQLSGDSKEISIQLPTTYKGFKDTYLPLIVKIDSNDVSQYFQDFDLFKENAVMSAYNALINGQKPEVEGDVNKDLVETRFNRIQELHNKLFSEYDDIQNG